MDINGGTGFAIGLALGSAVTWYFTKKYCDAIKEEEIKSVEESYSAYRKIYYESSKEKAEETTNKPSPAILADTLKKNENEKTERVNYSNSPNPDVIETYHVDEKEINGPDDPRLITRSEFIELNGYTKLTFTYYSDGIFADEANKEIDELEKWLGEKYDKIYVGICNNDEIYLRNEALQADIEIVKDLMTYEESLNEIY